MTEPTPTPIPPAVPPAPGDSGSPFKVFQTKEQYEAALNRKLGNYVQKSEVEKLNQLLSSKNNEIQSWQTKATTYESELANYRLGDLRQKVGKEAGLPADWIEELKGTDEASLKAHAEALRKKLGIKQHIGNPVPPLTPGTPQTENDEMNAALRALAGVGGPSGR